MAADLAWDKFWVDKCVYHDAERKYHESLAKLQKCGQKFQEADKITHKSEQVSHRKKENKISKMQLKTQNINAVVDSLTTENDHLTTKNSKNCTCNTTEIDSNKREGIEVIRVNEHVLIDSGDDTLKDCDKKPKQKDAKEKKNKSEKKAKKLKDKEEKKMGGVGVANVPQEPFPKSSLAGEVIKARQYIKSSLECIDGIAALTKSQGEQKLNMGDCDGPRILSLLNNIQSSIGDLVKRVAALEVKCATCPPTPYIAVCPPRPVPTSKSSKKEDNDDDVDLFGSESDEEDESSKKIREQRLAEYAAKKSKKPVLIAKSNIILDVKPWDDETNMKDMEINVRKIEMDGLVWGASKLVPLAYGIHKLQISCVVEDDKVSVDTLVELIEEIQDFVQSVDIAAFNKV